MLVRVQILFDAPIPDDMAALKYMARELTNDPKSVRVFPKDTAPDWLVAEFTMPTEAQYKAVDKIDRAIRFSLGKRMDSIIAFPKSEQERQRAKGKAERRRAARRAAQPPKTALDKPQSPDESV